MPRVHSLTNSLAIWVFANDHAPPHFHLIASDETDALIDLRTLQVIEGTYKRQHLAAALSWAGAPENRATLLAEWERLNERD